MLVKFVSGVLFLKKKFFFRLQFRRPVSASRQAVGEAAVTKNKEELDEHFALADFTAEDASQVSFKAGDKVFVKTKDESGKQETDAQALCIALSPAS